MASSVRGGRASGLAQTSLGAISLVNSFETAQDMAMITTASSVSLAQVTDHVTDGKYALQANFQAAAYRAIQFDSSKQPRRNTRSPFRSRPINPMATTPSWPPWAARNRLPT
jgi:hypothetical protein